MGDTVKEDMTHTRVPTIDVFLSYHQVSARCSDFLGYFEYTPDATSRFSTRRQTRRISAILNKPLKENQTTKVSQAPMLILILKFGQPNLKVPYSHMLIISRSFM